MNRNTVNFVLDVVMGGLGLCVLATGLLLGYVLPHGSGRRGASFLGLARHDWSGVHLWLALGLTALVVVHVLLHAAWVRHTAGRLWRTARPGGSAG